MPRLRGVVSNVRDRIGDVKPERFYVLRFCFGGARDILVWLMSDVRHFPPPWSVEELDACYSRPSFGIRSLHLRSGKESHTRGAKGGTVKGAHSLATGSLSLSFSLF